VSQAIQPSLLVVPDRKSYQHSSFTKSLIEPRAEEMAGTVVYLASKAGGYTFGQTIVIDGVYLAVNPSRS
jgi:NAD(P)-dependent dehydrogenase (short-subunit alcohol dehydrogenase family)